MTWHQCRYALGRTAAHAGMATYRNGIVGGIILALPLTRRLSRVTQSQSVMIVCMTLKYMVFSTDT